MAHSRIFSFLKKRKEEGDLATEGGWKEILHILVARVRFSFSVQDDPFIALYQVGGPRN
jgi:hypothetical protein